MKRVTLELGGKGPNIILPDADLESAISTVIAVGFANCGQACVAGTRILAPRSRLPEILDRIKTAVAALKVGDSTDPSVNVGPMVSQKQWDRVQGYIQLGLEEGAELLVGGEGRPRGLDRGWFAQPTVFTGVNNDMRIAREEIFGPVLCVIPYDDEEEAISIANDTSYGLQAYVESVDVAHARQVAERLESGRVVINGAPHEPLPRLPRRRSDGRIPLWRPELVARGVEPRVRPPLDRGGERHDVDPSQAVQSCRRPDG